MRRDQQFEALISQLQGIDVLCASCYLREPEIANVPPKDIACADGFTWHINGVQRAVHAATFTRATIASGMIYLRVLSHVMDISATRDKPRKPPILKQLQRRAVNLAQSGDDIKWYDIPDSKGLTLQLIASFGDSPIGVRRHDNDFIVFSDVYLKVLKAVDKLVAHLTHEDVWADVTYGEIVSAGVFVIVAAQHLLLETSWADRFDDLVFNNSRNMLPDILRLSYMDTVDTYRVEFLAVEHLAQHP